MKRIIRSVCLLLAVVMVLTIPVLAAGEQRASNFFMRTSTFIEKKSGTTFEIWFDVTAVDRMDELGAKTIKVQRSSDGSNWMTMMTYSKDNYPQLIDEDTVIHTDCITYTGSVGYYYRAYVTYYAKNSTGTGEYSEYSSTVRVP